MAEKDKLMSPLLQAQGMFCYVMACNDQNWARALALNYKQMFFFTVQLRRNLGLEPMETLLAFLTLMMTTKTTLGMAIQLNKCNMSIVLEIFNKNCFQSDQFHLVFWNTSMWKIHLFNLFFLIFVASLDQVESGVMQFPFHHLQSSKGSDVKNEFFHGILSLLWRRPRKGLGSGPATPKFDELKIFRII